jgi:hypothetical protein
VLHKSLVGSFKLAVCGASREPADKMGKEGRSVSNARQEDVKVTEDGVQGSRGELWCKQGLVVDTVHGRATSIA